MDLYTAEAHHNNWDIIIKKEIRSKEWETVVNFTFENTTNDAINICWHDWYGNLDCSHRVEPDSFQGWNAWASSPYSIRGIDDPSGTYTLNEHDIRVVTEADQGKVLKIDRIYKSYWPNDNITVGYENMTNQRVQLCWHDWSGVPQCGGIVEPWGEFWSNTVVTSPISVRPVSGYSTFKIDNDYVKVMTHGDNGRKLEITEFPVPEQEEDPEDHPDCVNNDNDPDKPAVDGYGTIFMNSDWMDHHGTTTYASKSGAYICDQRAYHRNTGFGQYQFWCFGAYFDD